MSLKFILGNSGSGKSEYLYERTLREAKAHPDTDYLFLVPEQYTMAIQKELVQRQTDHAIMNVDVMSFQRMAFRVFDELGMDHFVILEETGKNLVLRKVAQQKFEQLKMLKGNIKKIGYISELKSLISELTQYDITPADVRALAEQNQENEPFALKMQDVAVMYQGFREYLEGSYITAEEVLEELEHVADKSQMLKNSVLVLDGFTGFTPLQLKLMRTLFPMVKRIEISLSMDQREDIYSKPRQEELFYMSKKTVHQLIQLANETQTEVEEPLWMGNGENRRFQNAPALFFLEQNLFRRWFRRYPKETTELQLYTLRSPRAELAFAAQTIRRMIRLEGMRYRDFAIVTGALGDYANYAEEIFAEYEIPVFLDTKKTILFHPLIECIRSILEMLEQDFSYESVFRYLKTGLADVTLEEIDLLENYVLALGIRGRKRWQDRWEKVPYRWEEAQAVKPEEIRSRIMERLQPCIKVFYKKNADVREQTTVLYGLLRSLHIEQKMKEYQKNFEAQKDLVSAKEYEQIYGIVIDLLDKVVELLGEERLTVREYREILEAGFESAQVGVIPPGYDRVTIGDIERTRIDHVQALFFLGVNDGVIPKAEDSGGMLSQMEREKLALQKLELAPSGREKVFIQKFYLYLNLTKPQKALYVTCAKVNAQGKALRRSYLIGTLQKMFPKVILQEREDVETYPDEIATPKSSMHYYIRGLQDTSKAEEDTLFVALHQWYERQPEWKERVEVLQGAAFFQRKRQRLTRETARALYGVVLENSVTRLEQFASCAYAHFLRYGLKLSERQLCEFEPVDMGNIFHGALEQYSVQLGEHGLTWFDVEEEQSKKLLEEAFARALEQYHGEALQQSARDAYMSKRMKRILDRTVWALQHQVRSGIFQPESYEVAFSFAEDLDAVNFQLSEEEKMHLKGRIDRVDTMEKEDKLYVKIIDYKSGHTEFQLLSLYHGMQLQLVVYLNAAMELMKKKHPDKEIIPAGVFYYHLDDPLVEEKKETSEEAIWQDILKKLKMDGLVNSEEAVYRAMDQNISGSSNVLPIAVNKDGTLSKTSSAATKEQFQNLSDYVHQMIGGLGQRIVQGDIDVSPYRLGEEDGCAYCPYSGICGYDEKLPGYEKRKLEVIGARNEILERIREQVEGEEKEKDGNHME